MIPPATGHIPGSCAWFRTMTRRIEGFVELLAESLENCLFTAGLVTITAMGNGVIHL